MFVTYTPQSIPSDLEQWKEWVQSNVPRAFPKKLRTTVSRPRSKVVEIAISDVLDSNRFSELDRDSNGAESRLREVVERQGVEAIGWFQPYHEYDEGHWGIYLHASSLVDNGLVLRNRLMASDCPSPSDAFEIANRLVMEHELFHARVETFALSQEMTGKRPAYRKYSMSVYRQTASTPDHLEEALANYVAREFIRKLVTSWISQRGWNIRHADIVMQYIDEFFDASPAGYRDWRIGAKPETWRLLATQILSAKCAPPSPVPPLDSLLKTLPNEVARLNNVPIWITTEEGIADRLFGTPSRREAARFLESKGYIAGCGGKHPVFHGLDGMKFPLPTGG